MLASNSLETPVLGLVGRPGQRFSAASVRERLGRVALPERVAGIGFEDELAVLGSFVAGPASLKRLAGDAPTNTDDHPVVTYRAPRITYAPESSPRERLTLLLRELALEPAELLVDATDSTSSRRLSAYWLARNRFIESGRDVQPSARVAELLAQVQAPLLSVLSISPDFRPAYDPLLGMATALARSDVSAARTLLGELVRVQPARNEAQERLMSLSARQ